jgi:hypothetical protein
MVLGAAEKHRRQEAHNTVERFSTGGRVKTGAASAISRPTTSPGFIAAALDLAVGLLDLADQQRERTAGALEEFLVGQVQ